MHHQQIVVYVLEAQLLSNFTNEQRRRLEDSISRAVRTEGAAVAGVLSCHNSAVLVGCQLFVHPFGA